MVVVVVVVEKEKVVVEDEVEVVEEEEGRQTKRRSSIGDTNYPSQYFVEYRDVLQTSVGLGCRWKVCGGI